MINVAEIKTILQTAQQCFCERLSALDQHKFQSDDWVKTEPSALQGSGRSCILEEGNVIERGGVNFSHVKGSKLPKSALSTRPDLADQPFEVLGVSVVIHPRNPHVPTSHMNVRLFVVAPESDNPTWWFGGGFDLTPYYPIDEDVYAWHEQAKTLCDRYDPALYAKLKRACDDYFYLPHRNETRGVGGLFYDNLNTESRGWSFEQCLDFMHGTLQTYLSAYSRLLKLRHDQLYSLEEREFQLYRRGRYVEFNLLHDRGTIFGLQSGGRVESILMSLPNRVKWQYDFQPAEGSKEAKLQDYLKPRDWLTEKQGD